MMVDFIKGMMSANFQTLNLIKDIPSLNKERAILKQQIKQLMCILRNNKGLTKKEFIALNLVLEGL